MYNKLYDTSITIIMHIRLARDTQDSGDLLSIVEELSG
jgi:hypothetical protein